MDERDLSFDFESGLDARSVSPKSSAPIDQFEFKEASDAIHVGVTAAVAESQNEGRKSYRKTVCRYWLRGLCMTGDACGFLHQYDKSRMPVCRFFRLNGDCREQDCIYRHTIEEIKECNMYKFGFCPNGLGCRYRHVKLPGPPPPVEEVFQKLQQLAAKNFGGSSNRFFQNRNRNYPPQPEKFTSSPGHNTASQGIPARPMVDAPYLHQQKLQVHNTQQPGTQNPGQNNSSGQQNQGTTAATPLPQGISRYFRLKSCNRDNFESVPQGVWKTQRSNESILNEAFDSVENVILIFSVN